MLCVLIGYAGPECAIFRYPNFTEKIILICNTYVPTIKNLRVEKSFIFYWWCNDVCYMCGRGSACCTILSVIRIIYTSTNRKYCKEKKKKHSGLPYHHSEWKSIVQSNISLPGSWLPFMLWNVSPRYTSWMFSVSVSVYMRKYETKKLKHWALAHIS